MKVIYNSFIPFKGFLALNLFGVLFVRSEYIGKVSASDLQHEAIHSAQYKEMLYVGFLIWYAIEWIIKLCIYRNAHKAYRNISFEKEAYLYQDVEGYLEQRRHYDWMFI